jgi:hypothetical protein
VLQGITNRVTSLGNMSSGAGGGDSLHIRRLEEDSTTVRLYFLGSPRAYTFDSSINDYTIRFPIPATHIFLGNDGTATRSILFAPQIKAGWDPGFHALDVYKWRLENIRFFNATKPYTELSYTIASKAEQIIEILHTQNIRPYWNFSFNYRLISSPGSFRNQKSNHNNYLFTSWYQSPNKRYNNYFIFLLNKLQVGENGGIVDSVDYLNDHNYDKDRLAVPTKIGGQPSYETNYFDNSLYTGNRYKETNFLLRQQYDFGRKDSLVTDTTVIPLFYPRLRFEHTFKFGNYQYNFQDLPVITRTQSNSPDSLYYKNTYNIDIRNGGDTVFIKDKWKEISNDFSIYQFPDANNLQQFIKLGLEVQLLKGTLRSSESFYNTVGHAEYRNRSKNQKWDITAFGRLYLAGTNSGDYHAYISLQRLINPKVGSLQLGFENVNRTPPFIYNQASNFYLDAPKSFGKENTIHLFGAILVPRFRINLSADYYLISNYLYLTDFYRLQQEPSLFNVLRVNAFKTFNLGTHFRWHADVYLQQKTGAVAVNMPTFYTRNRIGYEGTLGFPHLNIAMGTEVRYHTPYRADNYSPVLGQFFYQDSTTISNLPQIDAYLHLKIKSFKAYLRFENLNTLDLSNGLHFTHNNFAAPGYPFPGLIIRFGIYWSFVN